MWPSSDAVTRIGSPSGKDVLRLLLAALVALKFAALVIAAAGKERCNFIQVFKAGDGSEDCQWAVDAIHYIYIISYAIGVVCLGCDIVAKYVRIFKTRRLFNAYRGHLCPGASDFSALGRNQQGFDETCDISTPRLVSMISDVAAQPGDDPVPRSGSGRGWFRNCLRPFSAISFNNISDVPTDHWVIGASRSFYIETSVALREMRALAVLLQVPTILYFLSRAVDPARFNALSSMAASYAADGDSPQVQQNQAVGDANATNSNSSSLWMSGSDTGDEVYIPPLCQESLSSFLCQGHLLRKFLLQTSWSCMWLPLVTVLAIPSSMWSDVSERSARRLNDTSLIRQLQLPWLLLPLLANCVSTGFVYFSVLWKEDGEGHVLLRHVYTVLCISGAVYGVVLVIWSRLLQDTWWVLCDSWSRARAALEARARPAMESYGAWWRRRFRPTVAPITAISPAITQDMPEAVQTSQPCSTPVDSESYVLSDNRMSGAIHPQQIVAVYCGILTFCSSAGSDEISFTVATAARIITLLVIVFLRESRCTMADLTSQHHNAAGLGLLVHARKFARALQAKLDGKACVNDVPTYKATALRMSRTMAVSYRWQGGVVMVNRNLKMNMSEFQMQVLADSIKKSGCDYVWLDCISVPQWSGLLQNTLLSRMMAVYSSAHVTLVIRGRASNDFDRYHRRCWTVQEFCCAKRLMVVTEPGGTSEGSTGVAVTGEEEDYFMKLRDGIHTALLQCNPFWLRHDGLVPMSAEKARFIWNLYQELAGRTHSSNEADKLRALCPMLANTPLETHTELLDLVDQIQSCAGMDGQQLDARAQSRLEQEGTQA